MENQHRQIAGYRELSQPEIDLMNRIKELAEVTGALVESLKYNDDVDRRWLAIGTTELQQGFMALTRSVARPTTF